MRSPIVLFLLFLSGSMGYTQEGARVLGQVLSETGREPLAHVQVGIEANPIRTETDTDGRFEMVILSPGEHILTIHYLDFITQRIPLVVETGTLDLGTLYLERDITTEQTDNLITLTDAELLDDGVNAVSSGLLQATRDVFLNRAAFDFGQAFFRVRGYDSRNGQVLINGIPMNQIRDGRPQWNHWGGLNDVTRNQEFSNGLAASEYTFGGILGNTHINTRPTGFRPGTRFSVSASNRTYAGRAMATYTSKPKNNTWAYSVSGSRRWAKEGYVDGTLYDAFSLFGALEYQLNPKHSILFTGIWASNRRGRSSAITEEVFQLVGKRYNPYWGEQDRQVRNSRERRIVEPIVMLNHFYDSERFRLNTGISYQTGTGARSRLGYYNAPNPDPTYYRYLPSFYINSPIGANFISAVEAREGFLRDPQINWGDLYAANSREKAVYVLYDDVSDNTRFSVNTVGNLTMDDHFHLDLGGTLQWFNSANYARITDLLGAGFHEDIDPFSDTRNDLSGNVQKRVGDRFNYNYAMEGYRHTAFAQLGINYNRWNAFLTANLVAMGYQREGLFLNERYPESSAGKGEQLSFFNFSGKGGFTYTISGRHWITLQGIYGGRAPVLQNVFINPRENHEIVPQIQSETLSSLDLGYHFRMPDFVGRLSGYYTR
ncbi:MAG: carboxypeptidase-like regulatory domain-containing protein, partial [Bacteroidota bacterium]